MIRDEFQGGKGEDWEPGLLDFRENRISGPGQRVSPGAEIFFPPRRDVGFGNFGVYERIVFAMHNPGVRYELVKYRMQPQRARQSTIK